MKFPALFLVCTSALALMPIPLCNFQAHAAEPTVQSGTLIIPGISIGTMQLGDTHADFVKTLGEPSFKRQRSVGIEEAIWDLNPAEVDSSKNPDNDRVHVIYASGKAIQIGVTSSKYRAPGGFTTRNTLAQFLQGFKNIKKSVYKIKDTEDASEYELYFYDDVDSGISFMLGTQDYFDHSSMPYSIYVHHSDNSVMPDMGASPVSGEYSKPQKSKVVPPKARRMSEAERREKFLSAGYVREAVQIYTDSLPLMSNMLNYMRHERDGNPLPRSVWRPTLDNLESNARRYKSIKVVPTTMKRAHSYAIEYANNTIEYVRLLRLWANTGDQDYVFQSQPYVSASNHYLELMTAEYERVIGKIERGGTQ